MNILQTIFKLSIPVGVLVAIHYYLWVRFVRDPQWPTSVHIALTVGLVIAALLIPLALFVGWVASSAPTRAIAWVGYTWLGVMFLLLVATVVSEVARLAMATHDATRRLFLSRGIALGVGALATGATGFAINRALRPIGVKTQEITLERLSPQADGLVIAQITDTHIGPLIRREFIEDVVAKTNALNPDIIAITGDMVDGSVAHLLPHVEPFAKLKARYGVYFVTGNHEYYSGADAWIAEFQQLGMRVLRNERVEVGPEGGKFDLAGVDDWTAHTFGGDHGADLKGTLKGRDDSKVCVLLAHNPKAGEEAIELGVDLQISGHTHGGQIWPFDNIVKLVCRWIVGLYKEGNTQIYVSAGTGYWGPPMRIGTTAEITKIVLRAPLRKP